MKKIINESDAAEVAQHLGLTALPYGKYADATGNVVAMVQNGRLVRVGKTKGEIEAETQGEADKARQKDEKAWAKQTGEPVAERPTPAGIAKPPVEHKPTGMSAQQAGKVKDNTPGAKDIQKINGMSKTRPDHITEENLRKFIGEAHYKKRTTTKLSEDDLAKMEQWHAKPDGNYDPAFLPYAVRNVVQPSLVFGFDLTKARAAINGKWWVGSDRKLRHVKYYEQDATHGYCEHLANSIYSDLKVRVPTSYVFTYGDHGSCHSSNYVRGTSADTVVLTTDIANKLLDGFAVDVLLANWDVFGTNGENIVVDQNDIPYRTDNGGTLLFRAVNKRKANVVSMNVLLGIPEWNVFSTSKFPLYANVFKVAGIDNGDALGPRAVRQIDMIVELHDKVGGWDSYVSMAMPHVPSQDRELIANMLNKRTALLVLKRETILQTL